MLNERGRGDGRGDRSVVVNDGDIDEETSVLGGRVLGMGSLMLVDAMQCVGCVQVKGARVLLQLDLSMFEPMVESRRQSQFSLGAVNKETFAPRHNGA